MSSYLFSIGDQILVYALRVVGKVTKAIDRKVYDRSSLSTDASAPVAALVNSLSRDYVLQMPFFPHACLPSSPLRNSDSMLRLGRDSGFNILN